MKIGLLGDTHGNYGWMLYALDKFNREGITTILQLGDFGIWPGTNGEGIMKRVDLLLKNYKQTMYVVPGNHEDYDQINAVPVAEDGWQHFREHILLAPRGHRWEWGGMSFVALGGAPSVDRQPRLEAMQKNPTGLKSWWAEEDITEEDVQKVIDGGYADVMVCHDAPNGVDEIHRQISGNPHGFKGVDLIYAADGRERLTRAFKAVAPNLLLHGHYHFLVNEYLNVQRGEQWHRAHVLGLSKDQANFSLGCLDTDTREAVPWDIFIDYQRNKFV